MQRYVYEFIFGLSTRDLPFFDKLDIACEINFMRMLVAGMEGRRLTYKAMIQ